MTIGHHHQYNKTPNSKVKYKLYSTQFKLSHKWLSEYNLITKVLKERTQCFCLKN